jgi:acetoin utilization deacetylase AcuC-like enzyme
VTLLYNESCFLDHETGEHPERADRIRSIPERLTQTGLAGKCRRAEFEPVNRRWLTRVHSPAYIDEIWALSKSGGGHAEEEVVVGPASYSVAMMAAGCACDATQRLIRGEDATALCLVRPPGHHAMVNQAMGFCIFNNVAVAARLATDELGLDRVLIVDWDVHHGNGTQATFWEDPKVGFLSIHRWPFYPGTGDSDETGGGTALGFTANIPVEYGTPREEYISRFAGTLEKFADKVRPQLVFISAGFDAHRLDPIGDLGLETEDYSKLTRLVMDVAKTHAGGKLISILEGGYNPQALTDCIEVHLAEMVRS